MKKWLKRIVLASIIIVLSFLYARIDKNTYIYDRNTDSSEYIGTGILQENQVIKQTFVCKEDHIDGINLKSTVNGNVENIVLEYTIQDNETGEAVSGTIAGTEINNNKFNKFKIQKINHSKNKEYTLLLKVHESDENNGISFYVDSNGSDSQELTVKEQETQGALVVRTLCHRFDLETFIVLLGFIIFVVVFIKVLYKLFK